MGFKCGIVGLPNVGKSTLFNALTRAGIQAENYPFCTIEPNVGVVAVPDHRLKQLSDIVHPQRIVSTTMEFVDIAGLVAGASKGEGLGNQFLANIRETDAIAHVVRCFDNDDIIHVANRVSPVDDIEVIHTELLLADLDTLDKALLRIAKQAKSANKDAIAQKAFYEELKVHLDAGHLARTFTGAKTHPDLVRNLLTAKPMLYIANVDEKGLNGNTHVERVRAIAARENAEVVVLCVALESEIAELDEIDILTFLEDYNLKEPGLNRLIRTGYHLLNLQTYFTAGVQEVRAWTIPIGATAPQAAGKIHTDFERGFIRAEIISFDDFIHYRGEAGAKEAGKWRLEGKEYIVKDGDVIHFRFNT